MIAGVVLAAGTSSRLGTPKQLLELGGRPLLQQVVDLVHAAGLADVVLVLGHRAEEIGGVLAAPEEFRVVVNPAYREGAASSLRAGLAALGPDAEAAVVLLGDQPHVDPGTIGRVIDAYRTTGTPIVRAAYGGLPSHPVLIAREVWPLLEGLEGDIGARAVMEGAPGRVLDLEMGAEVPPDVDTWEQYERLRGPRP